MKRLFRRKREIWIWSTVFILSLFGLTAEIGSSFMKPVWAVLIGLAFILLLRRLLAAETELDQSEQIVETDADKRIISVINHYRHDWMNEIQVLFGYVSLKKYDYIPPFVEKIKLSMHQETLISKLGPPALVAYFYSYRTNSTSMELNVELEEEIKITELPLDANQATELIIRMIEMFKRHAISSFGEPNTLSLELTVAEDHLLVDYVFRGVYSRMELESEMERYLLRNEISSELEQAEFQDHEATVAIRLPFMNV